MSDLLLVFQKNKSILLQTIWDHLQLSLISLLLAVLIAVPLGLYLGRRHKIAEIVIGFTAVLQTIPSLALLGFLIPLIGIGKIPAAIALTIYALLPILRNTYTGIREINPALIEAAQSMGMNRLQLLRKIQLPLAMSMIMAGIRTAMVLIIGTATLASLIGAGGLGDLILTGIQRADNAYILLGAIPAALLAILFDAALRFTEKRSRTTSVRPLALTLLLFFAVSVAPLLAPATQPSIVIGGKLGAEPRILIEMYKQLIEQNTNLTVQLKPNMGGTDFLFSALKRGDIDIYPEFSGTVITALLKEKPVSTRADRVYEQARTGLANTYHLTYLKPMKYNNTYALAVTKKVADMYHLRTISDVKNAASSLKAGFTYEFKDRQDGYQGLKKVYQFELPSIKTMDAGLRAKAIQSGDVNIIDAYSTDGYMIAYHLVTLEDNKHLFPPYQGAPLLNQKTIQKYPQLEPILNQLQGKITDDQMREMNYRVDFKNEDPAAVARDFLQKNGLLKK
ncbi:ABC transporter permease/substrate-binding protein [Aneurinibacillus sp. Ricciae_BoGa-3]|uniref:ABC transporter permease/substrate-binding protein n=1 Tax=Aneurinibacillus sp. Ricciae_BoGa-3 TaxID=3022697 RepID=UPI002341832A|nr:ABC transporter permease/substrate-binding protein [Aneurinibacillus sp. Ricciae_BoGa-3]WCK54801.1 ABC transporter permease/substrate-binding protein [Aneurinibacillus sp. Ricciae_BoGa-3]